MIIIVLFRAKTIFFHYVTLNINFYGRFKDSEKLSIFISGQDIINETTKKKETDIIMPISMKKSFRNNNC